MCRLYHRSSIVVGCGSCCCWKGICITRSQSDCIQEQTKDDSVKKKRRFMIFLRRLLRFNLRGGDVWDDDTGEDDEDIMRDSFEKDLISVGDDCCCCCCCNNIVVLDFGLRESALLEGE